MESLTSQGQGRNTSGKGITGGKSGPSLQKARTFASDSMDLAGADSNPQTGQTIATCPEELELQTVLSRYLEKKRAIHLPRGRPSTKQDSGVKDGAHSKSEVSESSTADQAALKHPLMYPKLGLAPHNYIKGFIKLYDQGQTVDYDTVDYEANDSDVEFVSTKGNKLTIPQFEAFIDLFEKLTGFKDSQTSFVEYESLDSCLKFAESRIKDYTSIPPSVVESIYEYWKDQ